MAAPKIRAEFVLDPGGRPRAENRDNRNHYKIRLFVADVPQDTYAVTYKLHPSYYNPVREVRRGTNEFEEVITSYGDYVVKAEMRSKKSVDIDATDLSRALKETYGPTPAGPISEAIQDLEAK
jgi:pYEATS domain-containing protein involved in immunity